MNAKTTISISEARRRIFAIADEVQKPNTHYTFTENGKPKAVLMSADEFDSLMEDFEILNSPETLANIKKAEEEYKRGEYITWDAMKKELAESRQTLVVADKPKKKYSVKRRK
ncbi:MAG: type II toxin-antitoxin system Phd/YefM family antitoxin [bacterium]|nr:type II toxin-antitoxin system Phd/YefM family antitoxin [bacterium]